MNKFVFITPINGRECWLNVANIVALDDDPAAGTVTVYTNGFDSAYTEATGRQPLYFVLKGSAAEFLEMVKSSGVAVS